LTIPNDDSSESELWAHLLSVDDTPDKKLDLAEQKEIVRETVAGMPDNRSADFGHGLLHATALQGDC